MKKVKITVLKTEFYPELAERYLTEGREAGPCPLQQVGDVFYYEGGAEKPEGLCPWAWIDIYRSVSALSCGATYTPWQKQDGASVVCCTDGLRPVTFLLEAEEQSASAP